MLRLWVFVFCSIGIQTWAAKSGSVVSCPGFCVMHSESCHEVLDNTACGSDFRCCLDGTDSVTESVDITTASVDHSDGPFETAAEEVEDASELYTEFVSQSSPKFNHVVATSASPQYSEINAPSDSFSSYSQQSDHESIVCPGACIPELYSRYCEYLIPSDYLCSSGSMCCVSKKQAEEISNLDENAYNTDLADSVSESISYSNVPQSSYYETEQIYCPGTCVSPSFTVFCDRILSNYYCPSNSMCCNNATYGMSLKKCSGHCIPNNLRPHCRSPLRLVSSTTCRQSTTCCEQSPNSDNLKHQMQSTRLSYINPFYGEKLPESKSSYEVLDRLAKDESGNYYSIELDGSVTPLRALTQQDHLYNHYSRVSEFDQEDGLKVVIFTDKNDILYYQQFLATPEQVSYEDQEARFEDEPLGMPDADISTSSEEPLQSNGPVPEDIGDIEESLKNFIIPEEGDALPSAETTKLSTNNRQIRPECPGSCLSYYLRFTCFGSVGIYDGFSCENTKSICCASTTAIQEHEEFLRATSPLPRTPTTMLERNFPSCGVKGHKEQATVDGRDSLPGEWCWQVAIISSSKQYLCAGVLIDRSWVITAAHCVSGAIRDGQSLTVAAGVADLTDTSTHKEAQSRKVISSSVHHNHNRVSLDNDIALLKLDAPLELSSDICIVCLPMPLAMPKDGTKCVVSGYGFPAEDGNMSLKTRAAVVELVDDTDCMANVTNALSIVYLLPSSSFCAGNGNGSSCQGDAGAPLVCEHNGIYELYGVLSWTLECGREDVPSVYVNIPSKMSWIHRMVTSTASGSS